MLQSTTGRPPLVALLVKNPLAMWETWFQSLLWEDPLEKGWLPTPAFLGFPGVSAGEESDCSEGDLGSISVEKIPWIYCPLQCSGLEISMGCIVHGALRVEHD